MEGNCSGDCYHAGEEAAEVAVRKVFAILGVDVDDPEKVEEFRKDLRSAKAFRQNVDRGIFAVVGLIAVGTAGALWVGVVNTIRGH